MRRVFQLAGLGWQNCKQVITWLVAACAFLVCAVSAVQAERLAFVVGNSDYDVASDLANPVNDATAVADALKRLGFKVTLLSNAGGDQLWTAMDKFVTDAEGAESALFYYSGHAFQMSGVNYLVPVSAKLASREGVKAEAWSLDRIIARLQSRNRQTLIFLDACRNDPLPASVRGSGAASDGLARVQTGVGTFVAFSTGPGGVSADGIEGAANSPFTSALLSHIETEGISISDMMIEVRNDVENATARKQVPWDQSSLREQFYFVPPVESGKQVLSEADYELLAQLSPADRKQFMDLLAQSGFDEDSLGEAEAEISIAEANLVQVASQTTILGAPATETVPVVALPQPTTQVATAPDAGDVDNLVVLQPTVTIGDAPDGGTPDIVVAALALEENTPIRLAALDFYTRDISLNEVTIQRFRLVGKLIGSDTEADRAILTSIDPRLLDADTSILGAIDPAALAKSVQAELKRVGCYQMKVDGSWGKGSRTALTSYFLAKRKVPDSLEPTDALYGSLKAEDKVVCEVRVAKSAVKTGNRVKRAVVAPVEAKANVKSKVKTGNKQETAKTRITKGTIGMTGSF